MSYVLRQGRRIEVEPVETGVVPRRRRTDRHIGCPLDWLKRVYPLLRGKEQLAIALWLHRRRAVCGDEAFTAPNQALREDLGLGRWAKYRVLRQLEEAGIVSIVRDGKRATRVRIL